MRQTIAIRLANIDDMKSVFDLSNDDIVRANSIHISKAYRGKNLGFNFLKIICKSNSNKNIIAYIKTSNAASKKIFEKNNFSIFDIITINSEKYYLFKKAKAK